MARARRDLLTRLADAGEEAIAKLADTPGADRLLGVANTMRDRMDEMQKRLRGLDELEQRVAALERRLDAQDKAAGGTARKAPARKTTQTKASGGSAPKRSTGAKGPARSSAAKPSGGSTRKTGGGSPG